MISYERLLVPVDGSEAAATALGHALDLAAATGATVDVVHVVEAGGWGGPATAEDHVSALEARGDAILDDVESRAMEGGIEVTTERRSGTPHRTILEYAAERGPHLLVMGRHGAGTVGERLLGGVTERVLRAGTYPALTAWADGDEPVTAAETVLLPTDGSESAARAGEHAAALATLAGATVHVVAIADVAGSGGLFDAGGVSDAFVENVEAAATAGVDRLADSVRAAGVPVETAVRRGRPAAGLRGYIEEHGIDAVVMGAHGRGGVERLLLGSVTERLLRSVAVPMLVVPGSG